MTTLRATNKYMENGGEWFCEPENKARLEYVKREVEALQKAEPDHGWKLQCRGTQSGWHDFGSLCNPEDSTLCYHPETRTDKGAVVCCSCGETILP